jgi:branched-chain amino acid aminotransferase
MLVFLNGKLVAEEEATVSIFDRGFLYGDGLFESLRVYRGKVFRWREHWERLTRGAEFLKIRIPFGMDDLAGHAAELIARNGLAEALLRITVSRGVGVRGYSPKGAEHPTVVMTLHPVIEDAGELTRAWRVVTASRRLPAGEALAEFKTCNKLAQVLARAEADAAGADEALVLNTDGDVVEGASSNLFWIADGTVCTPALLSGILAGVTRLVVLEICGKLGLRTAEARIKPVEFGRVEGAFVSLSTRGVIEIGEVDGQRIGTSLLTGRIRAEYEGMVSGKDEDGG